MVTLKDGDSGKKLVALKKRLSSFFLSPFSSIPILFLFITIQAYPHDHATMVPTRSACMDRASAM